MNTVLTIVASSLVSTGIVSVIMKFFVEAALKEVQAKKKQEQERRERRYKLEDEWQHNVSRVLFWMHHGVKQHEKAEPHAYWNGDLQTAMDEMHDTEKRKKSLDREQLAEVNE